MRSRLLLIKLLVGDQFAQANLILLKRCPSVLLASNPWCSSRLSTVSRNHCLASLPRTSRYEADKNPADTPQELASVEKISAKGIGGAHAGLLTDGSFFFIIRLIGAVRIVRTLALQQPVAGAARLLAIKYRSHAHNIRRHTDHRGLNVSLPHQHLGHARFDSPRVRVICACMALGAPGLQWQIGDVGLPPHNVPQLGVAEPRLVAMTSNVAIGTLTSKCSRRRDRWPRGAQAASVSLACLFFEHHDPFNAAQGLRAATPVPARHAQSTRHAVITTHVCTSSTNRSSHIRGFSETRSVTDSSVRRQHGHHRSD